MSRAGNDAPPIQSAQGWQPIETAPKGKRGYAWMRLAWGPDEGKNTGDGFYAEGKFFASARCFKLSGFPAFEYRQIEVTPTHWMPLPAAPDETPIQQPATLADDVVRDALALRTALINWRERNWPGTDQAEVVDRAFPSVAAIAAAKGEK